MRVIGISGLENAVSFKRAHWPGLEEREYRISQGHDAAAALVVNGAPVAAVAEERFNREKHSGRFPQSATSFCLSHAGLEIGEIDEIAHAFDYEPYRRVWSIDPETACFHREVCSRGALSYYCCCCCCCCLLVVIVIVCVCVCVCVCLVHRYLPGFPDERVRSVDHHLAHAASAYYTSGWDDCLVVVVDGMGEMHGTSVYRAHDGRLDRLARISALDSIGILYSVVTLHLGFDFNSDEYKIMGLAPYGDPERFRPLFEEMVELYPDGRICIPARCGWGHHAARGLELCNPRHGR